MKKDDGKKTAETVSNILHKASDISKKVADGVQKGAQVISDKTKNDSYLRRMKKYNPVFPNQYQSESFNIPNMIKIVDDAVRRDIDVCQGSIGWLENSSGMEVLCLYDEAIEMSGLKFIPTATCDAFYYVDNFDRKRFIRTDCIFSKAHEEKLAELEHIAHALGAKSCSVEIVEDSTEIVVDKKKFTSKTNSDKFSSDEGAEKSFCRKNFDRRSGKTTTVFEGNSEPKRPILKWFVHDDNINRLVEMRCSEDNSIKTRTLELHGASSATMSQKTAYAIDCVIAGKATNKMVGDMESQATKEHRSKLIFDIEF